MKPEHIVFDLDETLISSNKRKYRKCKKLNHDCTVKINNIYHYYVHKRPYADKILNHFSKTKKIYLFTRASQSYTEEILEKCFPNIQFERKLYRESCGKYKDIRKLGIYGRGILIDDKIYNKRPGQKFHHIKEYKNYNKCDSELLKVIKLYS